jgi:hypothetical protein
MKISVAFHGRGRESFSGNYGSKWTIVARKRLPTPFASCATEPNPTLIFCRSLATACLPEATDCRTGGRRWGNFAFRSAGARPALLGPPSISKKTPPLAQHLRSDALLQSGVPASLDV